MCECVFLCVCESGELCFRNMKQSVGISLESASALFLSSGRDSGSPPRTRSQAACQRPSQQSALKHPLHKRTNRTASTTADQVVGTGTSGKRGSRGLRDVREELPSGEQMCTCREEGSLFVFLCRGTHFPEKDSRLTPKY